MRALIVSLALVAGLAHAAPLKLAVVAGNNGGTAARPPLRFAEEDATRVAATLIELAGVKPEDLKLLRGRPRAELEAALTWATERIAAAHQTAGAQVVLYLYLSSHGDDGRGLELGTDTLPWAELKAKLTATRADVRVAFVDACNASGLLEVSGRAAAPFAIRAEDRLTVSGEALITSSAANEPSLEAGEYKGSVFTHHLLAALRGAADRSGDGQVSLEEAYRYAYARTVEGESGQHPGYGFKLAGHGELFVSAPKAGATLTLPRNVEAVTVSNADTGDRYLEVRQPESRLLALPPGRWEVQVWRGGKARVGRVTLAAGGTIALDDSALTAAPATTAQLVRLSATRRFCIGKVEAKDDLSALGDRLVKEVNGAKCPAASVPVALTLSRTRTRQIRISGTAGDKPFSLDSSEAAISAELTRVLTGL